MHERLRGGVSGLSSAPRVAHWINSSAVANSLSGMVRTAVAPVHFSPAGTVLVTAFETDITMTTNATTANTTAKLNGIGGCVKPTRSGNGSAATPAWTRPFRRGQRACGVVLRYRDARGPSLCASRRQSGRWPQNAATEAQRFFYLLAGGT
jgi:hypothetical protein